MKTYVRLAYLGLLLALVSPAFAQLKIDPGVVVKFDQGSGIVAHDRQLIIGEDVALTSIRDDQTGGQTLNAPATPAAGDWLGVRLDRQITQNYLKANGVRIRYAGQNRSAAFDLQSSIGLSGISVENSSIGLRVGRESRPNLQDFSVLDNLVGVQSLNAGANLRNSELVGNTDFAAQNLTGPTLVARRNWWGAASGPFDPLDNPTGTGGRVSTAVDYGSWLDSAPMLGCTIRVVGGTVFSQREIPIRLRCRNAAQFRVSEDPFFPNVPFQNMPVQPVVEQIFQVSPSAGQKIIFVQFRAANGSTRVENVELLVQYGGAVIEFTQPLEGLPIIDNAPVPIAVSARPIPGINIAVVKFYVGREEIGTASSPPYSINWDTSGLNNGDYVLEAFATTDLGVTTGALPRRVQIRRELPPGDTTPPVFGAIRFNGQALADKFVLPGSGVLTAVVTDPGCTLVRGCIGSVRLFVSKLPNLYGTYANNTFTSFLPLATVPNGQLLIRLIAEDLAGNETRLELVGTLNQTAPSQPEIQFPQESTVFRASNFIVSGRAVPGSSVQLFVDGAVSSPPVNASPTGIFSQTIQIPRRGPAAITAQASNISGPSALSAVRTVQMNLPEPAVLIARPFLGEIVRGEMQLDVDVINYSADSNVAYYLDSTLIGVVNSPYDYTFAFANVPDGPKQLRAVLRQGTTELAQTTRNFTLRKTPQAAPPFVPPYVGTGLSALPSLSYGDRPVVVTGRMRLSDSAESVANVPLTLVFRRDQSERRVNVVTDANGDFNYSFQPRSVDEGEFSVMAMHPQAVPFANPTVTGVANFVVSRLRATPVRLIVQAPRNLPQAVPIRIRNSKGVGAVNVRLVVRAEDQPNGSLPRGISFEGVDTLTIPPDSDALFNAQLLNTDGGGAPLERSGNVVVTILEDSSGTLKRGTARLDYELFDAEPLLRATPTTVLTGVRRGESATELVRVENKGLVSAENLRGQLLPSPSNPLPSWISLASTTLIKSFAPGDQAAFELRFAPNNAVAEGIYSMRLRVLSTNSLPIDVPISVSVNKAGEGSVRFKVVDTYTNTLDANNLLIQGLGGASVSLRSESNPLLQSAGQTDALGELLLGPLPPGRYLYTVQAGSHEPESGRIVLRAGVTVAERVFLDYRAVSFTWSVTPTTVIDQYNVTLNATYQTLVPAPVLLVEPSSINISELSVGEFVAGELSVTNYGLLRADDVELALPETDAYFRYEYVGTIPNSLAANERASIDYRITKLADLPDETTQLTRQLGLQNWLGNRSARATTTAGCRLYQRRIEAKAQFVCAAGDRRKVGASSLLSKAYGEACVPGTPPIPVGGGSTGNTGVGGWGGGSFAAASSGSTKDCGPDCAQGCACSNGCELPVDDDPPGDPPNDRPRPPPKRCK